MLINENRKNKEEINIFDNIPTVTDMLLPDVLQEKQDYLILGYNRYSRIFVMTIYPEQTWIGWLDDLYYIGNINSSVINQLTRKLVQSQSEYSTYSRQGNILHLPELEKQIGDLEDLRMLVQTNQDRLFFATIFITLNAENLQELNKAQTVIRKVDSVYEVRRKK